MYWRFDGNGGEWEAVSESRDENGEPLIWRIVVCEDGTFSVNDSDSELLEVEVNCFGNLVHAKQFCEHQEYLRKNLTAYA